MSTRKVYIAVGIDPDNDIICNDVAVTTSNEAIENLDDAFGNVQQMLKVLELTVPAKWTVDSVPVVKLDLTK